LSAVRRLLDDHQAALSRIESLDGQAPDAAASAGKGRPLPARPRPGGS
jgi:hypothetical protein